MKNYLLTIGIDDYKAHPVLANCVKDVRDFTDILFDKYSGFDAENHLELLNSTATCNKIQEAFVDLKNTVEPNDNLIVFFSGHGHYDDDSDRGYWIPVDGTKQYTTWISNTEILSLLEKINCKHLFLIADSCFSHSLLITDTKKSNEEYNKKSSRWALVSAYDYSYTSPNPKFNSHFAKTILEFLEVEEKDFRVSKLIEHVKDNFNGDHKQSPQGHPLNLKGHKGGEFIFQIEQNLDSRDLRGYENFQKVLKMYKNNVKFIHLKSFEDKTAKIGYQIYKEIDPVVKRSIYYLYLYSGIVLTRTLNHIKSNLQEIRDKSKQMVIFLQKESKQSDPSRRMANVTRLFKPINSFYIDDFIRDTSNLKLKNHYSEGEFLQIKNFIMPSYKTNEINIRPTDNFPIEINRFIDTWFKLDEAPIIIIKGSGGIGKTTFAQFVADRVIQKTKQIIPLFIDTIVIKDTLYRKFRNTNKLTLYDFYEAIYGSGENTSMTEDQFNINLDAGNFLIIIDGLDEVISKIPGFNINQFLISIKSITNQLGGGKVIITCRTHFWKTSPNSDFRAFELSPFNIDQTNEFFELSLDSYKKKKRALEMANDFKIVDETENIGYHPYVLDIIRSIMELEPEDIELDLTSFNSTVLNAAVKNDYIVYRVCDRERKRIGQISVDDQVSFFKYLANQKRGTIKQKNFDRELRKSIKTSIDSTHIESFKAHPFLMTYQSNFTFKYDFFSEIFKAIEIAEYFNFNQEVVKVSHSLIETLSENCWFESSLNIEIAKRIRSWNEDDHLFVSSLVDLILESSYLTAEVRNHAAANVFNIAIRINHLYHQNNLASNTTLLKSLFESSKGVIRNLRIVNLNDDKKIRFDFKDLKIESAVIENYQYFYDCEFNQSTRFVESTIINMDSNSSQNKVNGEIFIDCNYDKNIETAINNFKVDKRDNISNIKTFVHDFFHLFYSNGKLGRQWEEEVIKPRFNGIDKFDIGYKKVIRVLKREDILQSNEEKKGVKLFISDKHKSDVIRFMKDGTISSSISSIIRQLS